MALAWPLFAGLAIAPLLGGRWRRIAELRFRFVWIFYVAIGMQIVAFPFKSLPWRTSDRIGVVLWLCSFGLLIVAAALNFRVPGVPPIAAGLLLNLSAVVSNGGHMPALPSALRAAGMHFATSNNSTRMASPHLAWLVDRWAVPAWVPWGNVFSVGDVLIATGGLAFALLATGALRAPSIRRREAASVAARS